MRTQKKIEKKKRNSIYDIFFLDFFRFDVFFFRLLRFFRFDVFFFRFFSFFRFFF